MTSLDRFTAAVREDAENLAQAAILRSIMRDIALAAMDLDNPPNEPITFLLRPYQG